MAIKGNNQVRFHKLTDGQFVSEYCGNLAWPTKKGFEQTSGSYENLKRLHDLGGRGTRKVPLSVKNEHRSYWKLDLVGATTFSK